MGAAGIGAAEVGAVGLGAVGVGAAGATTVPPHLGHLKRLPSCASVIWNFCEQPLHSATVGMRCDLDFEDS
jgi:hypothetical protein